MTDPPPPGGTGVVAAPGVVVTTAPVAAAAAAARGGVAVLAIAADGRPTAVVGRVVATDARAGVAVVRVDAGLPAATFGTAAGLAVGQPVYAVTASRVDGAPSLSGGVLGGVGRGVPLAGGGGALVGALQADARVAPGDALLDGAGRVVGLGVAPAVAGAVAPGGLGFALPAEVVVAALAKVRSE